MKKLIWGGLFAFVFVAGILTSFMPTAAESCCKKTCDRGLGKGSDWQKTYPNAETCCKKEACEKRS